MQKNCISLEFSSSRSRQGPLTGQGENWSWAHTGAGAGLGLYTKPKFRLTDTPRVEIMPPAALRPRFRSARENSASACDSQKRDFHSFPGSLPMGDPLGGGHLSPALEKLERHRGEEICPLNIPGVFSQSFSCSQGTQPAPSSHGSEAKPGCSVVHWLLSDKSIQDPAWTSEHMTPPTFPGTRNYSPACKLTFAKSD